MYKTTTANIILIILTITLLIILYMASPRCKYLRENYSGNYSSCNNFETKKQCDTSPNLCEFNDKTCLSGCQRKSCENIDGKDACDFASSSPYPAKEPVCNWDNKCELCPLQYVLPNVETQEYTCFKNRCEGLSKEYCGMSLFSPNCCWNEKKNKCECRSKKQNPQNKQCIY